MRYLPHMELNYIISSSFKERKFYLIQELLIF